jgi:hypothetical protein
VSASGPKRLKLAEKLLRRGRAAGAARVLRRASVEAKRANDQETLYAVAELVKDARNGLSDDEQRTFDAILAGVEEGPARAGVVEVGLVLVGIIGLAVGIFLPLAESKSFGRVAENTLIQSGWGWAFLGLAATAVVELIRVTRTGARSPVIVIVGVVSIALSVYLGTNDELLTLCPIDSDLFVPECEVASPGVGIYATGIAGLLLTIGGWQLIKARGWDDQGPSERTPETKQCPDCAETILAAANVCKHCGFRFPGPARGAHEP